MNVKGSKVTFSNGVLYYEEFLSHRDYIIGQSCKHCYISGISDMSGMTCFCLDENLGTRGLTSEMRKNLFSILSNLPASIRLFTINLKGFSEHDHSEFLSEIFKILPATITRLSILYPTVIGDYSVFKRESTRFGESGYPMDQRTNTNYLTGNIIAKSFKDLPASISHIDLAGYNKNEYHETSNKAKILTEIGSFESAFKALPNTVTTLNLDKIGFSDKFNLNQLQQLQGTLPFIKTIKLCYREMNCLLGCANYLQYFEALRNIFPNVTEFCFEHEGMYIGYRAANEERICQLLLKNPTKTQNPVTGALGLFFSSSESKQADPKLLNPHGLSSEQENSRQVDMDRCVIS